MGNPQFSDNASSGVRGAVLAEFALTAPLIIFFLMTVIEFGRLFNQSVWFAQTTYQTAMTGGDHGRTIGLGFMPEVAQRLYNVQNKQLSNKDLLTSGAITLNYDVADRTVEVRMRGDLSPLGSFFSLNVGATVTAPVLILGSQMPADYNSFGSVP